jgi:hypothetical protein
MAEPNPALSERRVQTRAGRWSHVAACDDAACGWKHAAVNQAAAEIVAEEHVVQTCHSVTITDQWSRFFFTCDPIERVETDHESAVSASAFTRHGVFARCPECRHATVGLERPWVITHAKGCSVPTEGYLDG